MATSQNEAPISADADAATRTGATWPWMIGIALVAFVARFIHLQQARAVVFFENLISDGQSYWNWASRLIGGDWVGDGVFYQAPLYPYFLACVRSVVGDDVAAVRTVQAAIGALACGLMVLVGRKLFDLRVGVLAGLLLALYPPAIFLDTLIQKVVLDGLLGVAAILAMVQIAERATTLRALWLGALLGLLALTRENALALAPVLALWLLLKSPAKDAAEALPSKPRPGWRFAQAGSLLIGTALVLAPVVLRNAIVGGEFALTTSQAGPNFYIGNHAGADGRYEPLRSGRGSPRYERRDATDLAAKALGHPPTPGEVSRYWLGQAGQFITEHPGQWLTLLGRKLLLALNWYEIPDAEDQYFYERDCTWLTTLSRVLHFGVLLPLGVAGMVLARGNRRAAPLLLASATLLATVVAFYVFARYRYSLVPLLVPFAAFAPFRFVQIWLARRKREPATTPEGHAQRAGAVPALVALVITAIPANWLVYPRSNHLAISLANTATIYNSRGDTAKAIERYREALRVDPNYFNAHYGLGLSLGAAGRIDEARAELNEALSLQTDSPEVLTTLGILSMAQRDVAVAEGFYSAALAKWPDHPEALNALGKLQITTGRAAEGMAALRRAYELAPDEPRIVRDYVQQLVGCPDKTLRDPQQAVKVAEKGCRDTGFRDVRLLDVLSIAYLTAGKSAEAYNAARAALSLARARKLDSQIPALEERVKKLSPATQPAGHP